MAVAEEAVVPFLVEQRIDKLLTAAREGNDLAFEELMRLYRTDVYRIGLGLLGQPDQAADIAQDVFLRFYKALHRLSGDKGLRAWLRRVTVNRCYDILRTRKRAQNIEMQLMPGCMQGGDGLDTAQVARLIHQSLDLLSPRERAAIVLTCQLGYSSGDAAKSMGCSPATVRVLTHKARTKIKDALIPGGEWR